MTFLQLKKRRSLRGFRRNEDGATAVEFALILPVFIALIFGTMEAGNMLYHKTTLQQGIETAGRYAMVHVDATSTEIAKVATDNSASLAKMAPTFSITQANVNGIQYSLISVTATYTILTPMFTGRTIKFESRLAVPQTKPEDFS